MDKILVAVFDSEKAAYDALSALKDLHMSGDISLYASSVVAKDAAGQVAVDAYPYCCGGCVPAQRSCESDADCQSGEVCRLPDSCAPASSCNDAQGCAGADPNGSCTGVCKSSSSCVTPATAIMR